MMTEKTGWAATGAPNIFMRTASVSVSPKSSDSHSFLALIDNHFLKLHYELATDYLSKQDFCFKTSLYSICKFLSLSPVVSNTHIIFTITVSFLAR